MVEVLAYGGEVDFEYGLVDFLFEGGGDVFEVVGAGAFDEYDGVAGFVDDGEVGQEGGGVGVEGLLGCGVGETVLVGCELGAYSDELLYAPALYEVGDVGVELAGLDAGLEYVGEYEHAACFVALGATVHEVEGDVERVEVAVVGVVDEGATVAACLDFESHGDGFEGGEALVYDGLVHA